MVDHLKRSFQKHPGVAIIPRGVGAREAHPGLKTELHKHATQPYLTAKNQTSVEAALLNATFAVPGRGVGEKVKQLGEEVSAIWRICGS